MRSDFSGGFSIFAVIARKKSRAKEARPWLTNEYITF
jgi:hypothetical protein